MEMPVALVRGVHINYEIVGTQGPFVALTPGSRRAYAELINLSKAIAANGYRVLLQHDGPQAEDHWTASSRSRRIQVGARSG
jgi:hypothetical protein